MSHRSELFNIYKESCTNDTFTDWLMDQILAIKTLKKSTDNDIYRLESELRKIKDINLSAANDIEYKEKLTFDELPEAILILIKQVNELKRLLIESQEQVNNAPDDQLLGVQDAAKFLNLSTPTIYSKVSKGELPFMKRSKRLYFSKIELMEYIKNGRSNSDVK